MRHRGHDAVVFKNPALDFRLRCGPLCLVDLAGLEFRVDFRKLFAVDDSIARHGVRGTGGGRSIAQ